MDLQTVLAFLLVAVAVELAPGPNFFLLVRTVPANGLVAGFGNIGGFAMGFLLHGGLAAFGLSAMVAASPLAFDVAKLLGGAYLMGTGTQALVDLWHERRAASAGGVRRDVVARSVAARRRGGLLPSIGDGFVTNLLNPKIALFYIAAFPAFIGVRDAPLAAFCLVLVHTGVAITWFSLVALSFARLTGTLASRRVADTLVASSGVVFIALGAGVVVS